jgi:hypothetical protein
MILRPFKFHVPDIVSHSLRHYYMFETIHEITPNNTLLVILIQFVIRMT